MSYRRNRLPAAAHSPERRRPGSIQPSIEPLGIAARRVEHEQPFAELAGKILCGAQHRCSDASTPRAAMHQHLGQICAVRLVLREVEDQLHRADDAGAVLGDEERALATRAAPRRDAKTRPPCRAERTHEAHGRAAVHAIDQRLRPDPDDLCIGCASKRRTRSPGHSKSFRRHCLSARRQLSAS